MSFLSVSNCRRIYPGLMTWRFRPLMEKCIRCRSATRWRCSWIRIFVEIPVSGIALVVVMSSRWESGCSLMLRFRKTSSNRKCRIKLRLYSRHRQCLSPCSQVITKTGLWWKSSKIRTTVYFTRSFWSITWSGVNRLRIHLGQRAIHSFSNVT